MNVYECIFINHISVSQALYFEYYIVNLLGEAPMQDDYLSEASELQRYSVDPSDSAFSCMNSPYPPKHVFGSFRSCQPHHAPPGSAHCGHSTSTSSFLEGNRAGRRGRSLT